MMEVGRSAQRTHRDKGKERKYMGSEREMSDSKKENMEKVEGRREREY